MRRSSKKIISLILLVVAGCTTSRPVPTPEVPEQPSPAPMRSVRRSPTPEELGSKNLSLAPIDDLLEADLAVLTPRERLQRMLEGQAPRLVRREATVIEARTQAEFDAAWARLVPGGVLRYSSIFTSPARRIPPNITLEPIPGTKGGIKWTSKIDNKYGVVVNNAGGSYIRVLDNDWSGGGIACDGGDWVGITLTGNYFHDSPNVLFHAGSGRNFDISRNKFERIPAYGAVVTYNVENFKIVLNSFFEVAEPFHLLGPGGVYDILNNYGERLKHIPFEIQDGALSGATINYIENIFHKWAASDGGVMGGSLIAQKTAKLNVFRNYIDVSQQPGVSAGDDGGGYGGQGLELGAKEIKVDGNTIISNRCLFWFSNYGPGSLFTNNKMFGKIVWSGGLVANGNPASGLPPASWTGTNNPINSNINAKPPPPQWPPTTQPAVKPPENFTWTAKSDRKIDFAWKIGAGATKYRISFKAKGAPNDLSLQYAQDLAGTEDKYEFDTRNVPRIKQSGEATDDWEWLVTLTVTTPNGSASTPEITAQNNTVDEPGQVTSPKAPTNVTATIAGPSSAVVTWTDASDNEASFRIERAVGTGNYAALDTVGSNTTNYTDTTVQAGMKYRYRVVAVNTAGTAVSSPSNELSIPTPPVTQPVDDPIVGSTVYHKSGKKVELVPKP